MNATKTQTLDMFLDRTANASTQENRLITRETEGGNVSLIAFGWIKVAEYNESRNAVTIFTGHTSIKSKTVNQYMSNVKDRADARDRDIILSGESPTVDTPNDGIRFVGSYISMSGSDSAVEKKARDSVINDLKDLD